MNKPVQIFNPLWVDIAIENDPMALATFASNIVYYLAKNMSEQAIVPLSRCGI